MPTAVPDTTIKVTDMTGREVSLDGPAEKIVTLEAADCEILYAIGAGDTLIGRGEFCDYPQDVLEVPSVQSGYETNIEQVIALEPQVIIIPKMAQKKEHVELFENSGVKVVVTDAQDINGVYEAIRLIGAVTGKNDEAEALVSEMQADFAELVSKVKAGSGKTIYFEVSPLQYDLWTAGSGTFMNELATMLGLTNIFADVSGWGMVSEEQVIERNPDYIVTTTMSYGDGPDPVEEIMGRKGWQDITAVKNGDIVDSVNYELVRPGPRLVDGARMLYELVYGD